MTHNAPYIAQSPIGHTNHLDGLRRLDWVIVGGESGPGARPMHPDWARSLRDQCQAAGVPFLFKQWGEWQPRDSRDLSLGDFENVSLDGRVDAPFSKSDALMRRIGKKAAGRLLDGRTWDEVPA